MKTSGTVAVAGPKFCGKTTTSRRFDASSYALNTKDKIELVQSSPLSILSSATPRLIDEWQNFSELWNCARPEVDNREQKFGLFIFTESSTPADEEDIYHSGAGRIVTLPMRLMNLYESNESIGQVSLSALFNKSKERIFFTNDDYRLQDTAFYLCRGGWPLSLGANRESRNS